MFFKSLPVKSKPNNTEHAKMWLFPCCGMTTSGSTEVPPQGLWAVRTIWRPASQTVRPWAVILSQHMAALLPISRYATETTPLSVITVMHITSALVHSNTALDLICSLVLLYIRNWINQISFTSQALFKIFICLVGRFIDGDESKSCKHEL